MNTSNADLKVSFFMRKDVVREGLCPVMGRIAIGNDIADFSCKFNADPALRDAHSGRVSGKKHQKKIFHQPKFFSFFSV